MIWIILYLPQNLQDVVHAYLPNMKICEENKEMAQSAGKFANFKHKTAKHGWKSNKTDEKVDKLRNTHGYFVRQKAFFPVFEKITKTFSNEQMKF